MDSDKGWTICSRKNRDENVELDNGNKGIEKIGSWEKEQDLAGGQAANEKKDKWDWDG